MSAETTTPAKATNLTVVPAVAHAALDPMKVARLAEARRANAAREAELIRARRAAKQNQSTARPVIGGVTLSPHCMDQAKAKGLCAAQFRAALESPYKITDVTAYPGQKRYCGRSVDGRPGVAVVVDEATKTAVTVYLDGVVTALRPDQMDDARALNSTRLAIA